MMSYRFARRSFLSAIGGAVGLEILLRNMEASAAGAGPPPRFLMIHWPVGTMKQQFIPTGTGTGFTHATAAPWATSGSGPGYLLSPFMTPELKPYTIAMHGFNFSGISGRGGCHEDGTPLATTGANSPGTRSNGGETDDGVAGGPSWDQIMLKHCAALSKKNMDGTIIGRGYYNTIADARIDSYETSTRCLSYGYTKVSITSAVPGGSIQENQPLKPTLAPLTTFNDLFTGFMPGGGPMPDLAMIRMLKNRRSVLDYSLKELNRLNTLAPANERVKIESHATTIRMLEAQLSQQIIDAERGGGGGVGCMLPMPPPGTLTGVSSDRNSDYGKAMTSRDDKDNHEAVGKAHGNILRAAFACDLIRVATFQWSPGTNHVAFKGCDPADPNASYMHHPLSHDNGSKTYYDGSRPSGTSARIWDAMVWINHWYFQKTADLLNTFRTQIDPLDPAGGNLLERTVCPMVTEVADASHNHNGHAALIVGGTKLGMQGGRYVNVNGTHNQLWATVAQAFLGANAVSMLSSEAYSKNGANPISGLWVAPT
jgi:hypothetical protein